MVNEIPLYIPDSSIASDRPRSIVHDQSTSPARETVSGSPEEHGRYLAVSGLVRSVPFVLLVEVTSVGGEGVGTSLEPVREPVVAIAIKVAMQVGVSKKRRDKSTSARISVAMSTMDRYDAVDRTIVTIRSGVTHNDWAIHYAVHS